MPNLELTKKHTQLVSVYDEQAYSEADFQNELSDVHVLTGVEREWIEAGGLRPYESDEEILRDAAAGRLVRVAEGAGFIARQYLADWTPDRSDPDHEFHYSPPYLRPAAFDLMRDVADKWQAELGNGRFLSITSLVRSTPYQQRLATKKRKLTIDGEGMISSHQVGVAFDIDGCGIVETDDQGNRRQVNPRAPRFKPTLLAESRYVLRQLLEDRKRDGQINFVEELPETQEHCFHVAVKPQEL